MKYKFALLTASMLLASAAHADLVVPAAAGNAQGPAPFNYFGSSGSHVQQVYSSSYFSSPQLISAISFRAYPGAAPSGFIGNTLNISNVTVKLGFSTSTGNDGAGAPSASFASNITGAQTVYSGALSLMTAATGANQPFDYTVNFSTPFAYDPSKGSLILDVVIPTGATVSGTGFGFLTFDNVNTLNDGLYSVVNLQSGGAATGTLDTSGAITKFTSTALTGAVPEPATWAMLILGFGFVGGAVRRRRTQARFLTA